MNISKDFADADEWDIRQQVEMTPEERQTISEELKKRFYGDDTPDVRGAHGPR